MFRYQNLPFSKSSGKNLPFPYEREANPSHFHVFHRFQNVPASCKRSPSYGKLLGTGTHLLRPQNLPNAIKGLVLERGFHLQFRSMIYWQLTIEFFFRNRQLYRSYSSIASKSWTRIERGILFPPHQPVVSGFNILTSY